MTTTGLRTARPPSSPHANLTATARTGTAKWNNPIWSLACTCGATFEASAQAIRSGAARCGTCAPSAIAKQIEAVLAALPGNFDQIQRRAKISRHQARARIASMRANRLCFVGDWARAEEQGSYRPIFHAGDQDDVACDLQPVPSIKRVRKYERRVKAAITKAAAGGPEHPRYIKHIARHLALATAAQTRAQPATWFSALPGGHP